MAIYLIRHGETVGNAARIVQLPDSPLSPLGVDQARSLAKRLAHQGIARIVTSDFPRALTTGRELGATTGASLIIEPLLRERNFGDFRGKPHSELGLDLFASDLDPPNGENWAVFHSRIDRAWKAVQALASETQGHLAVVTHAFVCGSIASRHLVLQPGQAIPTRWENTSVTVLDGPTPWLVRTLNCTAHLDSASGAAIV